MNLNETFAQTVWFGGVTSYGTSEVGTILTFIIYGIRDIFLMVVEILVNIASAYFLKQYIDKKSKLLNTPHTALALGINTVHPESLSAQQGTSKTNKTDSKPDKAENALTSQTVARPNTGKVSKSDRKLCVMVVIMCVLSGIEHFFYITCCAYPYFGSDAIVFHFLYYLCFLAMSIKHSLNLFLFFIFNNKFRSSCLKLFKKNQN
jgi:hypothetical protein